MATLCNLLVYNCDISPSHDKYRSPSGPIPYSCIDPINGSQIVSSGGISPLWELIFVTHLLCGAGTVQLAFAHPQNFTTLIGPSICTYISFLFHLAHGLSWKILGINT